MLTIEHRAARSPEPMLLDLVSDDAGDTVALQVCSRHTPAAEQEPGLEDRILDTLDQSDAPMTRNTLRARLRVNNQKLGHALAKLDHRGLITRLDRGWQISSTNDLPGETEAGNPEEEPAEG